MTDATLDTLVVRIAADTRPLRDALQDLGREAEGGFSGMAEQARSSSETMDRALSAFLRSGRNGFKDLKATALGVLAEIAGSLIEAGLGKILGGSAAAGGASLPGAILSGRRAAGGPVTAGDAFLVGERGPELFVPSLPGRIVPNHALPRTAGRGGERRTSITINIAGGAGDPSAIRHSAGQVAAAVSRALARAERNL